MAFFSQPPGLGPEGGGGGHLLPHQSIITSTSLEIGFPVFLVSTAEQVYTACVHAGWGKDDDATIQRLYLADHPADLIHQQTKTPGVVPRVDSITVDVIIDIFTGVHLAVSSEAMGFTEATGLDTDVIYDIISQAAGSNVQFVKHVPEMKKPTWSLKDVASGREVGRKLVCFFRDKFSARLLIPCWRVRTKLTTAHFISQSDALRKANSMGQSLPVAAAASQLFHLHLGPL